jgi:hypothetical protein
MSEDNDSGFDFVPDMTEKEILNVMEYANEMGLGSPNLTTLDLGKSALEGEPVVSNPIPMGIFHLRNSYRAGKVVYNRVLDGDNYQDAANQEIQTFLSPDDVSTGGQFILYAIFTDLCAFNLPIYTETDSVVETLIWIANEFIQLAYVHENEIAEKFRNKNQ